MARSCTLRAPPHPAAATYTPCILLAPPHTPQAPPHSQHPSAIPATHYALSPPSGCLHFSLSPVYSSATHPNLPQPDLPSKRPPMHNYLHTHIPTNTRPSNGASAASSSSVSPLSAPFSRRYRRAGMISANAARKRGLPPAALLARRSGCRCSWPLQHRLRPRRRRLH